MLHARLRRDQSWREDARRVLAGLDGLNRSQQRAIAIAMSSSFTLWQARGPHVHTIMA